MKPRSSTPFSSTVRTEGLPSGDAVASAIAVGSGSLSRTCSNQRANCRIGSASQCASLSGSPRYSRLISASDIQFEVVSVDDDARGAALGECTEEHGLRQRLLHLTLDQPRHRPRPECAVKT